MTFSANNELAIHVADLAAAEAFYVNVLGCLVFARDADCISLSSGALQLYLVRDPVRTHDAVVPSFDVENRDAAIEKLRTAGCTLTPIGPHSPGGMYVRDPFGVIFDVIQRPGNTRP